MSEPMVVLVAPMSKKKVQKQWKEYAERVGNRQSAIWFSLRLGKHNRSLVDVAIEMGKAELWIKGGKRIILKARLLGACFSSKKEGEPIPEKWKEHWIGWNKDSEPPPGKAPTWLLLGNLELVDEPYEPSRFKLIQKPTQGAFGLLVSAEMPQIWRMAPGENAEWWDECLSKDCILIGWEEVAQKVANRGSDLKAVKTQEEMEELFNHVYGKGQRGAGGWLQVWNFVHETKSGDIIVAKTGKHQILGIGIVTSDYISPGTQEHPLGEGHKWRGARKVDWHIITEEPVTVDFDLGAQTLVKETKWNEIVEAYKRKGIDVYERLWGQKGDEQPIQQESKSKLVEYFKVRGFHFSDEQIATFYAALKAKGFVILSGLSGTGKTKLAELFAELICPCQECHGGKGSKGTECKCAHLFLSVRPDWRDSKALLGYYNPLTEQYESTPLLRFLLRARNDYEKDGGNALPYFVILDEMNLSHVEYYFADFLSVLESGRDENGWTKEPLRLYSPDLEKRPDIEQKQGIPPELHLPPNLYIIGTVNIDETTYMFSPKVLDRAFTIEFRDVNFSSYPSSESGDAQQIADQIREAILNDLRNGGKFCAIAADKNEVKQAVKGLGDAKQQLEELNRWLQPYDLHFGYRVLDEIALFVHYAKSLPKEVGEKLNDDEALDYAVLMKVLPKFHGPRQRLERPIREVLKWAAAEDAPEWMKDLTKQPTLQDIISLWSELAQPPERQEGSEQQESTEQQEDTKRQKDKFRYPATAKKALQMLRQLYETGFASFAQ